jgi:Domain of unknown function (DUF397)
MTERNPSRAVWRTSSHSSANGECVEVTVTEYGFEAASSSQATR